MGRLSWEHARRSHNPSATKGAPAHSQNLRPRSALPLKGGFLHPGSENRGTLKPVRVSRLLSLKAITAMAAASAAMLVAGPPQAQAVSTAVGIPSHGRLVGGVLFPAFSEYWYTWNSPGFYSPNPAWRRYGTDRLVAMLKRVLTAYSLDHPEAARPGVEDISRQYGGWFGAIYGGLGHTSHQNGLDVDITYPRLDLCECAPITPSDVDIVLAQDLLDRFVAEGVQYVFTGPSLNLHGPSSVVIPLPYHDDHMHMRIYPPPPKRKPGGHPSPKPTAPSSGDGRPPTGGLKPPA